MQLRSLFRVTRTDLKRITLAAGAGCALLLTGAAIDGSRWLWAQHHHKAALTEALEAAVVGLARSHSLAHRAPEIAQRAAEVSYERSLADLPAGHRKRPQIRTIITDRAITVEAAWPFKSWFPDVFHIDGVDRKLAVEMVFGSQRLTDTEVWRGRSDIEIALMLDVSGALCDDGIGPCTSSVKLDAVKAGAHAFVDMALGWNGVQDRLRIALVPYAANIRVRQSRPTVLRALTDGTPSLNHAASSALCIIEDNQDHCPMPSTNDTVPLTNSSAELAQGIRALSAAGENNQMLAPEGARYVLGPEWRDLWPPSAQVMDYEKAGVDREGPRPRFRKIAVIVATVESNITNTGAEQGVERSAAALCSQLKSSNVDVFAIGVIPRNKIRPGERRHEAVLAGCANSESHTYLLAPEDVGMAFRDIALKLAGTCIGVGGGGWR
jgi:hypothetical protein